MTLDELIQRLQEIKEKYADQYENMYVMISDEWSDKICVDIEDVYVAHDNIVYVYGS